MKPATVVLGAIAVIGVGWWLFRPTTNRERFEQARDDGTLYSREDNAAKMTTPHKRQSRGSNVRILRPSERA